MALWGDWVSKDEQDPDGGVRKLLVFERLLFLFLVLILVQGAFSTLWTPANPYDIVANDLYLNGSIYLGNTSVDSTTTPESIIGVLYTNRTLNTTNLNLKGNDTASIGGGLLAVGACTAGITTIAGATLGKVAFANPDTYPGDGFQWQTYVSSNNTITVKVCGFILGTPTASVYHVRVIG